MARFISAPSPLGTMRGSLVSWAKQTRTNKRGKARSEPSSKSGNASWSKSTIDPLHLFVSFIMREGNTRYLHALSMHL
jgi:hypothetical protein